MTHHFPLESLKVYGRDNSTRLRNAAKIYMRLCNLPEIGSFLRCMHPRVSRILRSYLVDLGNGVLGTGHGRKQKIEEGVRQVRS